MSNTPTNLAAVFGLILMIGLSFLGMVSFFIASFIFNEKKFLIAAIFCFTLIIPFGHRLCQISR